MGLSGVFKGGWDRGLNLTKRAIIVTFVFVCCVYLVEICFMRYRFGKALRLINSVQELKIGVTSLEEVRQLSERFGGEFYPASGPNVPVPSPQSYVLTVWSPYLLIGGNAFPMPGPGLKIWGVMATLYIEDGYLSEVRLDLLVRRSDKLDLTSSVIVRSKLLIGPDGASYYVVEPHVTGPPTEALEAEVSPEASFKERRKAFDFNTKCLTLLRECRHVCEISPSAWKDLRERRLRYGDGRENVVDAECRQSLAGIK